MDDHQKQEIESYIAGFDWQIRFKVSKKLLLRIDVTGLDYQGIELARKNVGYLVELWNDRIGGLRETAIMASNLPTGTPVTTNGHKEPKSVLNQVLTDAVGNVKRGRGRPKGSFKKK